MTPIFFALHVYVLFVRLQRQKIDWYIWDVFTGVLGYADVVADVSLMGPSVSSINLLLTTVSQYGKDFSIKFNSAELSWLYVVVVVTFIMYSLKELNFLVMLCD